MDGSIQSLGVDSQQLNDYWPPNGIFFRINKQGIQRMENKLVSPKFNSFKKIPC